MTDLDHVHGQKHRSKSVINSYDVWHTQRFLQQLQVKYKSTIFPVLVQACLHLARDCMQLAAQEIMTASSAAGLAVLAAGTAAGRMNTADMTAAVAATAAANDAVSDAAAALVARAQSETAAAEARAARYQADAQQLHEHINRKLDAATAQVLHVSATPYHAA